MLCLGGRSGGEGVLLCVSAAKAPPEEILGVGSGDNLEDSRAPRVIRSSVERTVQACLDGNAGAGLLFDEELEPVFVCEMASCLGRRGMVGAICRGAVLDGWARTAGFGLPCSPLKLTFDVSLSCGR